MLEFEEEPEPITIRMWDGKEIDVLHNSPEHEKRRRRQRQAHTKGQRYMPEYKGKTHYLMMVNARECTKNKVTECYLASNTKPTQINKTKTQKETKKSKTETEGSTKTEG